MSAGSRMEPGVGPRASDRLQPLVFASIGVFTAAAVAITAGVTVAGARTTTGASGAAAVLEALARSLIVGLPLAVALYACQRPAHARFGKLLLLVSGLWFLASLATSSSPVLYSVGRVCGWLTEPALIYIVLAFPDGRLHTRGDRVLVAFSAALALTLFVPSALFVAFYPAPSPWSSCHLGCPHNAFMTLTAQPGLFVSWLEPVRETLAALTFLLVAVRLAVKTVEVRPLMRRMLVPVLAVASAREMVWVAFLVARRAAPGADVTMITAWLVAFAMPALALAFLFGLVRWHLFVSAGIRVVNAGLLGVPRPEQVRELLAGAFEDPDLQIATWSGRQSSWISASGEPVVAPAAESGRWLTEVRDGPRAIVAIVHDVAVRDDAAFVEAAAAAASIAFASDRVSTRTAGMVRELQQSRSRILAAADDERRRIERDLHDGAQQRLVALCIHLELAAEDAEREHPGEAAGLRRLVTEVEQALEEIRSLTHGIYPSLLGDRGLAAAVRSAARRSLVPARVQVDEVGEYPREISTAVYFCCVEALQNVAKHASTAGSAQILLRERDSVLYFSVSDDGPGMAESTARVGAGMLNMRDRMTTVGGQLSVHSRPGEGTRVSGRIPLAAVGRADTGHETDRGLHRRRPARRRGLTET